MCDPVTALQKATRCGPGGSSACRSIQLIVDVGVAPLVLLTAAILSVFKP
ncbi:hypothetical protein ACFQ69_02260 [Streptomyces sp. NPDC056470]